jgi:hypothetical protein
MKTECSESVTLDVDCKEEAPKYSWEYKKEFGIIQEMRKVVLLTKQATELELDGLRRKLERLTYGS